MAGIRTKIDGLERDEERIEGYIARLEQNVQQSRDRLALWQTEKERAIEGKPGAISDMRRIDREIDSARRAVDQAERTIQPSIDRNQALLAQVRQDIQAARTEGIEVAAGRHSISQEINRLQQHIRATELTVEFNELEGRLDSVGHTLDEIEKVYDKSIMGAYMQDKMTQLLNSQAICAARKRCMSREPQKVSEEKIRAELFPESQATRAEGTTYDRVKARGAR